MFVSCRTLALQLAMSSHFPSQSPALFVKYLAIALTPLLILVPVISVVWTLEVRHHKFLTLLRTTETQSLAAIVGHPQVASAD